MSKRSKSKKAVNNTDYQKLITAIEEKDLENLEALLQKGVNSNLRNDSQDFDSSPLFKAIQENNVATVELLLKHGADVNLIADNGQTLLRETIRYTGPYDVEILKMLINSGAQDIVVTTKDTALAEAAKLGLLDHVKVFSSNIAYHADNQKYLWIALCKAAGKGHLEIVEYLLKLGVNVNDEFYTRDCRYGILYKIVHEILYRGTNDIFEKYQHIFIDDPENSFYASRAAQEIYTPIVKLLLAHGAEIKNVIPVCVKVKLDWIVDLILECSSKETINEIKDTIITHAIEEGNIKILIKTLGSERDINRVISEGSTVLELAQKLKKRNLVKAMLNPGQKILQDKKISHRISDKITPNEKFDVLKILLKDTYFNIFNKRKDLETNLRIQDVMESWVHSKPDNLQEEVCNGLFDIIVDNAIHELSSLQAAKFIGFRINLLVKHGFDAEKNKNRDILGEILRISYVPTRDIFLKLALRFTDVEIAAVDGNLDKISSLLQTTSHEKQSSLIDAALYYAAMRGHDLVVKALIDKGANCNVKKKYDILFNTTNYISNSDYEINNLLSSANIKLAFLKNSLDLYQLTIKDFIEVRRENSLNKYKSIVETLVKHGAGTDDVLYAWMQWNLDWAMGLLNKYRSSESDQRKYNYIKKLRQEFKVEDTLSDDKKLDSPIVEAGASDFVSRTKKLSKDINKGAIYSVLNIVVTECITTMGKVFDAISEYYDAFQIDDFKLNFEFIIDSFFGECNKVKEEIAKIDSTPTFEQRETISLMLKMVSDKVSEFTKIIKIVLPTDPSEKMWYTHSILDGYAEQSRLKVTLYISQIVLELAPPKTIKHDGKAMMNLSTLRCEQSIN